MSSTPFDLDFFDEEEENVVIQHRTVIQQQEEHQFQPAAVPRDGDFEDANDAVLAQPDPELPQHPEVGEAACPRTVLGRADVSCGALSCLYCNI